MPLNCHHCDYRLNTNDYELIFLNHLIRSQKETLFYMFIKIFRHWAISSISKNPWAITSELLGNCPMPPPPGYATDPSILHSFDNYAKTSKFSYVNVGENLRCQSWTMTGFT
jgi:hypothetical protein